MQFLLGKNLRSLGLLKLSLGWLKFCIALLSEFYNLGQEALNLHINITYFGVNWTMLVSWKLMEELPLACTSNKHKGFRVLCVSSATQQQQRFARFGVLSLPVPEPLAPHPQLLDTCILTKAHMENKWACSVARGAVSYFQIEAGNSCPHCMPLGKPFVTQNFLLRVEAVAEMNLESKITFSIENTADMPSQQGSVSSLSLSVFCFMRPKIYHSNGVKLWNLSSFWQSKNEFCLWAM